MTGRLKQGFKAAAERIADTLEQADITGMKGIVMQPGALKFVKWIAPAVCLFGLALLASPSARAAVGDAAQGCEQTVKTVITKLRKNTPSGATIAKWAAWGKEHPNWKPSGKLKPRPKYIPTQQVITHRVALKCEVPPQGPLQMVGTLVPEDLPSAGDLTFPAEDVTGDTLPLVPRSPVPVTSNGFSPPGVPPIFPVGPGGTPIVPTVPPIAATPEMPSFFFTLTGVALIWFCSMHRKRRHEASC